MLLLTFKCWPTFANGKQYLCTWHKIVYIKGENVINIYPKWFGNFRWFELSGVNLSHGSQNKFESFENRAFEKSGVKLQVLSEANSMETRFGSRYRKVQESEGSMSLNLLFELSTRNGAIINKNSQTFWCYWFLQFLSSPSQESRIESVFITVGAWKHLHWLTGIAIFAPVGPQLRT